MHTWMTMQLALLLLLFTLTYVELLRLAKISRLICINHEVRVVIHGFLLSIDGEVGHIVMMMSKVTTSRRTCGSNLGVRLIWVNAQTLFCLSRVAHCTPFIHLDYDEIIHNALFLLWVDKWMTLSLDSRVVAQEFLLLFQRLSLICKFRVVCSIWIKAIVVENAKRICGVSHDLKCLLHMRRFRIFKIILLLLDMLEFFYGLITHVTGVEFGELSLRLFYLSIKLCWLLLIISIDVVLVSLLHSSFESKLQVTLARRLRHKYIMEISGISRSVSSSYVPLNSLLCHHASGAVVDQSYLFFPIFNLLAILHERWRYRRYLDTLIFEDVKLLLHVSHFDG